MKKYIPSLLVILAASVRAQSSVTLYGVVEDGLNYVSNAGGHQAFQIAGSIIPGSRVGFKGVEDLGGGLKAIFTLENGFDVNSGQLSQGGRLFGRQAFVGLTSNYGTITMGRQYDPAVDYVQPLTNVMTMPVYGGHPGDNDNLQDAFRVNNMVKFQSATYRGASVDAMYAFSNTAGGFSQNSGWGLAGRYSQGSVVAAFGLLKLNNPASNTNGAVGGSGGTTSSDFAPLANKFVAGAINSYLVTEGAVSYLFAQGSISGIYSRAQFELSPSTVTFSNYEFDSVYYITPALRFAGTYTYTQGHVAVTDQSPKYHQVSLILAYFLSKKTDVYAELVGQKAIGTTAQLFGLAASTTDKQAVFRIGIAQKF